MFKGRSSQAIVLYVPPRPQVVDRVAEQALYGAPRRGLRSGPDGVASGHAAYRLAQQRCGGSSTSLDLRI